MREKEQAEQQGDREKLKNMFAIWETRKIQQTKPKQKVEKKNSLTFLSANELRSNNSRAQAKTESFGKG